tara:strand:- start:9238 stop:9492 length:255 start_codon:yes stop_codon:yes gene_type:complete
MYPYISGWDDTILAIGMAGAAVCAGLILWGSSSIQKPVEQEGSYNTKPAITSQYIETNNINKQTLSTINPTLDKKRIDNIVDSE